MCGEGRGAPQSPLFSPQSFGASAVNPTVLLSPSSLDATGGSSGLELGISLPPRGALQGPGVRYFPSPKSVRFL